MIKLTEDRIKRLGFNYDNYSEEYSLWLAKNTYVNITFIEDEDFFVTLQIHQSTVSLGHIRTEYQLDKLINAIRENK